MKGKKVAWQLPTDGSLPKLGVYEQERVVALFKEMRKRGKKEKVKQKEELQAKQKPADVIVRACRAFIWRRRFCCWRKEACKPIRYTLSELLSLRYSAHRPSPSTAHPFFQTSSSSASSMPAPPGLDRKISPSPSSSPLSPSVAAAFGVIDKRGGGDGGGGGGGGGGGLGQDHRRASGGKGADKEGTMPDDGEEAERWKSQWKQAYLTRLDLLAETAWQTHKEQRSVLDKRS
jgi:hypothetical protein